jgi:hypothetical protein
VTSNDVTERGLEKKGDVVNFHRALHTLYPGPGSGESFPKALDRLDSDLAKRGSLAGVSSIR